MLPDLGTYENLSASDRNVLPCHRLACFKKICMHESGLEFGNGIPGPERAASSSQ